MKKKRSPRNGLFPDTISCSTTHAIILLHMAIFARKRSAWALRGYVGGPSAGRMTCTKQCLKLAHLQMGPRMDGNYLLAGFRGKFWKLNFVSGELCDFGLNSIDNDGLYYDDGLLLCGGGKGALYFGGDLVVSYANFQTGANKSFNVNRSLHLPSVDANCRANRPFCDLHSYRHGGIRPGRRESPSFTENS